MRARLAGRAAHPREAAFGFPRSRPPSCEPGVDSHGLLLTWAPGSFLCVCWDLGSYTDKASKAGPVRTPTSDTEKGQRRPSLHGPSCPALPALWAACRSPA